MVEDGRARMSNTSALARNSIFILAGIDRLTYVLNYEETQLKNLKGALLRLWDYIISTTHQILQI